MESRYNECCRSEISDTTNYFQVPVGRSEKVVHQNSPYGELFCERRCSASTKFSWRTFGPCHQMCELKKHKVVLLHLRTHAPLIIKCYCTKQTLKSHGERQRKHYDDDNEEKPSVRIPNSLVCMKSQWECCGMR